MADLNLRNIDPELLSTLKAQAAIGQTTLRDHCIRLLSGQAARSTHPIDGLAAIADTIKEQDEAQSKRNMRVTIPITTDRSAHDPTCRCLMCRPR
jgi:hypothetical protein